MTIAINRSNELNVPFVQKKEVSSTCLGRFFSFIQDQGKVGGLFGDFANCLKLANFWSKSLIGATTEASNKMVHAGCIIKSYAGVWELPGSVMKIGSTFQALGKGTAESVSEFVTSIFCAGKNVFDGVDLVGTRFGLLSQKVVSVLSPLSPAGTLAFASNEVIFKNIPSLQENWGENLKGTGSVLLKLVKHISLVAVGALALISTFFYPMASLVFVIPTLLTVSVVSSISGRFFDALVLSPKLNTL